MTKLILVVSIVLLSMVTLFMVACVQAESKSNSELTSTTSQTGNFSNLQPALPYTIVDTGQTKCYDNFREISSPASGQPFLGQDAQYEGNQPSYRDNGDGTITDLVTGLMWQKDPGNKVSYTDAVAGASTLSLGGYSDWRLPNIKELYSLILFSGKDVSSLMANAGNSGTQEPFLDTRYFDFKYGDTTAGERIIDSQYWSSTEYVSTTMNGTATVFGVNFADGRIKGYPKQAARVLQHLQFVRYVRGTQDYGINQFRGNADGTISDEATGLMWAAKDSGYGMDWQSALAWVQKMNSENYLGYNDWRVPNAKELQSIVDYSRSPAAAGTAAIDPIFTVTPIKDEGGKDNYPFYWTSTTHVDSNDRATYAAYVCFGEALGFMTFSASGQPIQRNGPGQPSISPGSSTYKLMDVHGAGAQRSDPKEGNPADYPYGHGPQGDVVRIDNFVRCVRGGGNIEITASVPASQTNASSQAASSKLSGLSVVTLGTGGPTYNPERNGPCALIRYQDHNFLVDMGNGTQAGLNEYGLSFQKLTTLMLTHQHIDHNQEFIPILLRVLLTGQDFNLIGPDGTQELYDFAREFYQEDLEYRDARNSAGSLNQGEVNIRELSGGESFEIDGLNISTAVMQHTIFTLAYRFEADGQSIVISGDTSYSENLINLAKDADVLVMDSGGVIMQGNTARNRVNPSGERIQTGSATEVKAHAALAEVADMAQKAGVKRLVLTHFANPGELDKEATAKAISSIYKGEVLFSYDLMEVICQ